MMPGTRKPANTPQWVFSWQPRKSPQLPKLIAITAVGGAFALLVTTVRIQVKVPEKSAPRKASVIHLGDDPQSRALASRAREGGPTPSRFEPSEWQGLAELERSVMDAALFQPAPYAPVMADLPAENLIQPVELAAKGQRFFPKTLSPPSPPVTIPPTVLAPVIYPLVALPASALPSELPHFEAAAESAKAAAPWRFIVRLDADGSVAECVSMEKRNEGVAHALEDWLHRVRFPQQRGPRWIALAIGFTNQPADGTDPR